MAATAAETHQPDLASSAPTGPQGEPAVLKIDAGIELEDFQKRYVQDKSFGLLFDGADGNPDRQIVRFRQLAALIAKRPDKEKKRLTKVIMAEANKVNEQVEAQFEKNATEGTTDHAGFKIPEPVIAEIKAFLKGNGDLSDTYYSRSADGATWEPRPIGDVNRDDIGIGGDKPHIDESASDSEDPMDEDTLTFVASVCQNEGGESLLAALLKDPKNKEPADRMAKALEGAIQQAAHDAGVKRDLKMPLGLMRSLFMWYVAFGYSSHSADVNVAGKARDSQGQAKASWEALVKRNGYPASWIQSFVTNGDGQVDEAVKKESLPYEIEDCQAPLVQHMGFSRMENAALEDAKKIAAALNESLKNMQSSKSTDTQQTDGKDSQKSGVPQPSDPQSKAKGPPAVLHLPGPALNGNISRFGEITSVKKYGFGWRVFVNAGTSECPVFVILRGSDFGRGVAEEFQDRFKTSTHDEIKSRKGPDVASVSAIVQTSGKKPSTYYLVNWDKKRIGEDKAAQDFVSETQLKILIGEANVKGVPNDPTGNAGYRQQLFTQRESQEEWIKQCKGEGLHPHTGEPITEEERTEYPWLFGAIGNASPPEDERKTSGSSDGANSDAAPEANIEIGSGFSIPKAGQRAEGSV